jgi:hypothetical protein
MQLHVSDDALFYIQVDFNIAAIGLDYFLE